MSQSTTESITWRTRTRLFLLFVLIYSNKGGYVRFEFHVNISNFFSEDEDVKEDDDEFNKQKIMLYCIHSGSYL